MKFPTSSAVCWWSSPDSLTAVHWIQLQIYNNTNVSVQVWVIHDVHVSE